VRRFTIVVHGGAGALASEERGRAAAAGCLEAARIGHRILAEGGSALEAVQAACVALEDNPLFNAGTGSCLNEEGRIEMDAAIMEGTSRRAGGVAVITGVRNPILVARRVLDRGRHVLLAGEGAERFARAEGFAPYPPSLLLTEAALDRWRREREGTLPPCPGTVGAVAIDREGRVAAATSTGGTSGKAPGRVGDSPIPGAGLYADDAAGAVSATGHGETILRAVLSRYVCDRMAAGLPAQQAVEEGIRELGRLGGEGGAIAVDPAGRAGIASNTPFMSWAVIEADGRESSGHRCRIP